MSQPRKVVDTEGARRADLAAIHMAKAALGWSDEEYRDIMGAVCGGVRSAGELDFANRKRFLAHLQACGWHGRGQRQAAARKTPWTPLHQRLWACWQQLADARLVADRDRQALNAWCKGQVGVEDLGWLTPAQLDQLIGSAKQWLKRGQP